MISLFYGLPLLIHAPECLFSRCGAFTKRQQCAKRCGACLGLADLSQLRQKFAEDKRRIAELKAARRFKPY